MRAKRGISGKQAGIVRRVQHLVEEVTAGDIDAVRRDLTSGALVSDDERVLEDARNPPRKASARLIVLQRLSRWPIQL